MYKYSPAAIIYILLNIISLLLLTILIIKLYISPNHFTKYTQFQLFIVAWGYTLGCLPTIIKYGNNIINNAFEEQVSICTVQQIVSLFFFYPLHIFPFALGFYIWCAIEKRNIHVERKYFWTFSSFIWCFSVCYNVFSFADDYVNGNFTVRVTPLLCKPPNSNLHQITYIIIIPPLFLVTLIFNWFAGTTLWKRWKGFSLKKNRWTALRLGHAIRLFICSITYTFFLGASLFSRILTQYFEIFKMNKIVVEDYVQPFGGIILFLIFAKNDSPAIFLPYFYYSGPEKLSFKSESYIRADSFLNARPPSLTLSFRETSNTMQQATRVAPRTSLLTITEEGISVDTTNNTDNVSETKKEIKEIENEIEEIL